MLLETTGFTGSGSTPTTSEKQNESGSMSGVTLLEKIGVLSSGGQTLGALEAAGAQEAIKTRQPKNQKFFMLVIVLENWFFCSRLLVFTNVERFKISMNLHALGWSDFFATEYQKFTALALADFMPARVTGVDRTTFRIQTELEATSAFLPGSLLHGADKIMPVIGDWVVVERLPDSLRIVKILPRRSAFSRAVQAGTLQRPKASSQQVMTANVDTVLIVVGLDEDFNLPRLSRYISAVQNSGAEAVVVLNKADLVTDAAVFLEQVQKLSSSLAVYVLSATQNLGLEQLKCYFQTGRTVALIGSSGVGKSTLTNQLLGREAALTGATNDHLGKHTTTARTMYFVPDGGLLVDNPGLREIAVWESEDFSDIETLAAQCKFRKCTHNTEFGCVVQKAIRNGKLEPERLVAYQKAAGIKITVPKRRFST